MIKESRKTETNWPFLYSVNVQTALVFVFTVWLSLLAPFPESIHENVHLNFIYDFIYEQLDRYQFATAKFSSFAFLGLIYGPIKLFTAKTNFSPIQVLLIMRIFLCLLTCCCWRFLQKRISFNFGSRVAFLFFLSEIFNWNTLNQSSRFIESNLIRSIILLSLGLFIEKKFLLSLTLVSLTLPILRENSLNLLSALLPLFLNRELFEKDPLAMFSFLSISGIVMAINPHPKIVQINNFDSFNIFTLISVFTIISGLIFKNFFILKLSFVYLIGNFLTPSNSLYFPFISIAFALSFSQISAKTQQKTNQKCSKLETIGIQLVSVFFALLLTKNSLKSMELSPAGRVGLRLNDLLISESDFCKIHISKTAQALGFSKFSMLNCSKVAYEFGTNYDENEMLQKFKYRVADINENADPAYWRVKRILKGISSISDQNSELHVKILVRTQAD